ncbi:MAG: beta galactosidase jelly roll domain-containing protein [Candidatus Dormibacteria bacterium]
MSSDCLLLALPQGLERQRLDGWVHRRFPLGEGEEQGYHRPRTPSGEWASLDQLTLRGRPGDSAAWYRAEFTHPGWGDRTLLRFDGAFTAANVWLNGRLLGSHFGFPGHFGFDISSFLETSNVLAVCVEAGSRPGQLPPALNELADDEGPWWPLGMVGRVWLEQVGSVVVESLDSTWRLQPGLAEATLRAAVRNLDAREMEAVVTWNLLSPGSDTPQVRLRRSAVVGGRQSVVLETRVAVDRPQLWWPWTLGEQHLYTVAVQLDQGDRRSTTTSRLVGIREVGLEPAAGGMAWSINGRRHFPRGAVLPPLPPGQGGDPIGAWRMAGLDLAVSRGQVPSERTAASADAAGVLLVVDPPAFSPGQGDEEVYQDHLAEAVGLVSSHASAAVLLQRGGPGLEAALPTAKATDEPYTVVGADREDVERVRKGKFSPQTALVLRALPDLGEAEGVLAATVALLDCTPLPDRDAMRMRFHVINDNASVGGRATLRWRLKPLEQSGWLPFLRDRAGDIDVQLPRPDQPAAVYEQEVSIAARSASVGVELGLEQDGEMLSYLEYDLEL